jgi:hypothetical protein
MPALDATHAREFLDLGANILAYGTDTMVLKQGYEIMQKQFAELGFGSTTAWVVLADSTGSVLLRYSTFLPEQPFSWLEFATPNKKASQC